MDGYLTWRAAEAREMHVLRHERQMVRAMRTRHGWLPGVGVEDSDLAGVSQPTALVYGTNDPLGSADLWRRKVDLVPHGELEIVAAAGHLPWYDEPGGVGGRGPTVPRRVTAEASGNVARRRRAGGYGVEAQNCSQCVVSSRAG